MYQTKPLGRVSLSLYLICILLVALPIQGCDDDDDEQSPEVNKTLVTINIADDQLYDDGFWIERGFVFLSDEDGKLIASIEYANGDTVILESEDFDGQEFFLTEVIVTDLSGQDYARYVTFKLERGKNWVLVDGVDLGNPYAGHADVTFTNAVSGSLYFATTNWGGSALFDEQELQHLMYIGINPSKMYVARAEMSGKPISYGIYSGITSTTPSTINLSLADKSFTKLIGELPPGINSFYIDLMGFPVEDDFSEPYYVHFYTIRESEVEIHYPGTDFPSYFSEFQYETDEIRYTSGSNSEIFELKEVEADINFTSSGSAVSYDADGNFDFFTSTFTNENEDSFWTFYLPKGSGQRVPIFERPAELQAFDISTAGAGSITTHYLDGMTDYDGLRSFIRSSSRSISERYEIGDNYIDVELLTFSNGGRLKPQKNIKSHPLRLNKNRLDQNRGRNAFFN
jgi:hypothetical protein